MDYPSHNAAFLEDVSIEVDQQLKQLAHHASVVLLCGNSELEQQAAMWGAEPECWTPTLFHDLIAQQSRQILKQAVYWPSSAHGGDFPHQPQAGTCSYYGVGAYKRGLDDAVSSGVSFATECLAFANVPGADALRRSPAGEAPQVHSAAWKSRVYRDQLVGWDFDDVREHYVEHLFGVRPDALRSYDPAQHLRLARAVSAEVMSRTMAIWRADDSVCGGALVWFLRDLWAGAGCGLVDELGAPKSALHALARVQQPVFATIVDRGLNGLFLHLVNETAHPLQGQVEVVLYRDGETVVARHSKALTLLPRSKGHWALTDWLNGFMDLNWTYRFGPPSAQLVVATWSDNADVILAQAMHFEPSQILVFTGNPGLAATAEKHSDGTIMVTLQTQAAAYGVHFDAFGWDAADDYFHMAPGAIKHIAFTPTKQSHGRWNASVTAINSRRICHISLHDETT
jgi:beta-mannosidase